MLSAPNLDADHKPDHQRSALSIQSVLSHRTLWQWIRRTANGVCWLLDEAHSEVDARLLTRRLLVARILAESTNAFGQVKRSTIRNIKTVRRLEVQMAKIVRGLLNGFTTVKIWWKSVR